MARDYRSAEVFSPGTRPLPLWLWLFAVLAISGFVFLIYYLDQYEKSKTGLQGEQQTVEAPAAANSNADEKSAGGAADKSEDKDTDFSFYKLLPKISVDVPKGKAEPGQQTSTSSSSTPSTTTQQTSTPEFSYVLQVASFKDYEKADSLKAKLAFEGLEAKIEKVTLGGSDVRHRVRIGPIQSEREMNKIRAQLRRQQIEPILLKVKG